MERTPAGLILHRVGRRPDPLAWVPWEWTGGGRYDDPGRSFRVLYAAEDRQTALKEVLAPLRLRERSRSKLVQALEALDDIEKSGNASRFSLTRDWRLTRAFGRLALASDQVYLDLRSTEGLLEVQEALGKQLGILDLGLGEITSLSHETTQAIARWAFASGCQAILYASRLAADGRCWAIFDSATFTALAIEHIHFDDPDLRQVASIFKFAIEPDGSL
jgi:hypothetical protein